MFFKVLIKVNLLHALSSSLQPNTLKREHRDCDSWGNFPGTYLINESIMLWEEGVG